MIERATKEQEVKWDPEAAHTAFMKRFDLSVIANQMRATAEQMPDAEMVKKGVKVSKLGEPEVRIPVLEYVQMLERDEQQAALDLIKAGGISAVEAYVIGRQGISYAGEIPAPNRNTQRFNPSLPRL